MMDPGQLLQIGKITGVFGIRGELRVYRMAEDPMLFQPGNRVMLRENGDRYADYTILTVKPHKNVLRVGFREIADRNAAEALVGYDLFIPRSELPETDDDTWYWCDLIGLDVFDRNDHCIGAVTSMIDTGSNDVFVVKDGSNEMLVPFIQSVVVEIDLENKRMVVDLPEGL